MLGAILSVSVTEATPERNGSANESPYVSAEHGEHLDSAHARTPAQHVPCHSQELHAAVMHSAL